MTDIQIYNDKQTQLAIGVVNATSGSAVATPSGTVFSAVSSKPASLGAAIGGISGDLLFLTPLVQNSTGISVTVSAPGMVSQILVFDIVSDPNLLGVNVNVATPANLVAQNVPTAPGP